MADDEKKGTVTPFNSIFTPDEAEKAARRVDEAIVDRRKELRHLLDYISDNSALIRLVQKLPEELSHDIMVPFGGSAFFPGRLIHTNELLVLLGEGYHAERSAKQTVDILQRRGKYLETQVESLKRVMKDLEAEAEFFDSTAAEVAEGLVEIREEYVEEIHSKKPETGCTSFMDSSSIHNFGVTDEEDEHAKIMARLDELEKEEEEAGSIIDEVEGDEIASSSDDEDEDVEDASYLKVDEAEDGEEEEEEEEEEDDDDDDNDDNDDDGDSKYVNDNAELVPKTNDVVPDSEDTSPETLCSTSMQHSARGLLQHPSIQSSIPGSKLQVAREGSLKSNVEHYHMTENPLLPPVMKEYLQKSPPSKLQNYSESSQSQSSKMGSSNSKAFTGSVIEHSHGLHPVQPTSNSSSAQTSRPISRFMRQKGNR